MWVVEYIIEDLMDFCFLFFLFFFLFFFFFLDLGLTGSIKCCKLSLSFWRRLDQGPYYYDSHISHTEMDRQAI